MAEPLAGGHARWRAVVARGPGVAAARSQGGGGRLAPLAAVLEEVEALAYAEVPAAYLMALRRLMADITAFGSTASDASSAIIAAIAAAHVGDTVLVPLGRFVTRPFNVSKNSITLRIDGTLR